MFFFFNDTATTEIYTLSLHDALPILKPNPWGFYDIHGNVFEWCLDIYKAYPEGRAYSDTGKLKILRGGAYYCPSNILRSACRAEAQKPDYRWILGGFRVVLAPPVDQVED